ncbi:nitroreductase [Plantactinospora sp. KBS50]|uniref:Acg family FMN-binding oxidoreductase n=1 Tax=Plantactinospora sp. KBS50 TaxID=2024580 RepID=UPI000BAAAC86|nr:nitroreductase [Plantactinospora sp. KBS50]ASW54406.1 nitroreductase [Plantactinospora sp. KBS50]
MTEVPPVAAGTVPTALAQAAAAAGHAPSVHNTQPWRWRVLPDRLELHAVRERQLAAIDPGGRLLLISCGTGLHHAALALRAEGWQVRIERLPDPDRPDLLATVIPTGHEAPTDGAMRLVQSMSVRHTDRRPVSDEPVPASGIEAVRKAADEYAHLQILGSDEILDVAATAGRAAEAEADDPQVREELAYWTSRAVPAGTGLPPEVLPDEPAQSTVPGRDFGSGSLPMGPGHDRAATYALLYGDDDEPASWLAGGEALSAAWLTATGLGISVVPLSWVVEVTATREILRRALSGMGYPYLVLRLGIASPEHAGPPHTPRLPLDQVIDTSAVRGDAG